MDPMGGIVMTNDGNAILREITVQHPAAKTMIEIARTQDEEVGDGTTSVIVLAAEMLGVSHQFLEEKMHPTVVIQAYRQALEDAAVILRDNVSTKIDLGCRREKGDRHQEIRQGGEDSWGHHRGLVSVEGCYVQQGCHPPKDEEEDREPQDPTA